MAFHDILDELQAALDASRDASDPTPDEREATALLTLAVRLYASFGDGPQGGPPPTWLDVSPTEACTVAAALLRSQALTPFEFAIWFSGGAPRLES